VAAPLIRKLAVFGVGLIGGSFALALKKAGAVGEVVGVGRTLSNLGDAYRLGIIDEVVTKPAEAVAGADLVLLAVPVGQMPAVMAAIAPHLAPDTVVTDAGSTKQDVLGYARNHLANHLSRFVPAHPIAGAEKTGAAAASAELYQGRNVVVTPLAENDAAAVAKVKEVWAACGAVVREMAPQSHDEVFAAVSHLPHLLAFALVDDIAGKPNAEELFSYAASGFRDFTRIAGSSPEMWRDISLANREALLKELDAYRAQLERLRAALEAGDGAVLEQIFTRASRARNAWSGGERQ
jgi:prephenate dehydrogenase